MKARKFKFTSWLLIFLLSLTTFNWGGNIALAKPSPKKNLVTEISEKCSQKNDLKENTKDDKQVYDSIKANLNGITSTNEILEEKARIDIYETEPNDDYAYADFITDNLSIDYEYFIYGTITDYIDDFDLFRFTMPKDGTIEAIGVWAVDYYGYGWEDDLYAGIIDEYGNLISVGYYHDYGEFAARIIDTHLQAGTYYLAVMASEEYGDTYINQVYGFVMDFYPDCTVTFDSQGGGYVESSTVEYDGSIMYPEIPIKENCTFQGWYKEPECINEWNFALDKVTSDMTLYAKWVINSYTVTFNSQGGNEVAGITADYGSIITPPSAPIRAGYVFEGWYKELECINEWNFAFDRVASDMTLYAKWRIQAEVIIDKTSVNLYIGESILLNATVLLLDLPNKNVTWSSNNSSVAAVDSNGLVTAVGAGTTYITVTTVEGGYSATCTVTVMKHAESVMLNLTSMTINKGQSKTLIATVIPEGSNKSVIWSSNNMSVVSVDSNGVVTGVGEGTAIITVTTVDGGFTASCNVTVTANSVINKIRYGGANRFATAIAVSKAGWTTSDSVILVNAFGFADALTGVPYAHVKDAPILLTDAKVLTKETNDEIIRLKAKNIYILGGVGVVSQGIENDLRSRGYNVFRIAGSGRFETAIEIANSVIFSTETHTAVLTTAYNYPDALAISSYAAISGNPILYTDPVSFTDSTKNFIIQGGITKVIIPGGINAVSAAIENELKNLGVTVQRIAGSDRYSTAYNIVNTFKDSFKNDVMLATGKNFPDALAGGALAAKLQIPILLVQQNNIDDKSAAYIRSKGSVNLYILGGTAVISDNIVNLIKP